MNTNYILIRQTFGQMTKKKDRKRECSSLPEGSLSRQLFVLYFSLSVIYHHSIVALQRQRLEGNSVICLFDILYLCILLIKKIDF